MEQSKNISLSNQKAVLHGFAFLVKRLFNFCIMKKQTNKQEEKDLQEVWKRICKVLDKQKFVLILLLFSLSASAQFSVQPKAAFEYAANGFKWVIHHPHHPYEFGTFRAKSGIDFIYGKVSLEFDTHFYMTRITGERSFAPTRADFFTTLSYKITDKIKIYAENLCMHPVVTTGLLNKSFNGGYTSIGISYGY